MTGEKLFNLLKSFDSKEFNSLGKFINSPYFNESESNIIFYNLLKKQYPKFELASLSIKDIFNKLYPGEPFNEKKIKDRFTHMIALVKQFLGYSGYEGSIDFKRNLLRNLIERKLEKIFIEEFTKEEKLLDENNIRDEIYFLNKYFLEILRRKYLESQLLPGNRQELYGRSTFEIDNVINFFIIVMLKEYSRMFGNQRQLKFDHKFNFYGEILSYLSKEQNNFKDIVLINLLHRFMMLYNTDQNINTVKELKQKLNDNRDSLNKEVFNTLFIELYNYSKNRESSGEKEYGAVSFELLMEMVDNDVLLQPDNTMTSHTYINVVASAIRVNQLTWAENFITDFKNYVRRDERENAVNYNLAVLNYMKGYNEENPVKTAKYNEALVYLNKVKGDDFYYMTRIKNHALKIFFELDFTDSALSLIDSYSHYLSRNKIIPEHLSERYSNFIHYLNKIIKLKLKEDYDSLELLKREIDQNTKTEYRGWLTAQINIINKKSN